MDGSRWSSLLDPIQQNLIATTFICTSYLMLTCMYSLSFKMFLIEMSIKKEKNKYHIPSKWHCPSYSPFGPCNPS